MFWYRGSFKSDFFSYFNLQCIDWLINMMECPKEALSKSSMDLLKGNTFLIGFLFFHNCQYRLKCSCYKEWDFVFEVIVTGKLTFLCVTPYVCCLICWCLWCSTWGPKNLVVRLVHKLISLTDLSVIFEVTLKNRIQHTIRKCSSTRI